MIVQESFIKLCKGSIAAHIRDGQNDVDDLVQPKSPRHHVDMGFYLFHFLCSTSSCGIHFLSDDGFGYT